MPNLTPAATAILQSPIDLQPRAFPFMFKLDAEGRCRLAKSDEDWAFYQQINRRYWTGLLAAQLASYGNPLDYQTACKVFKLELRELLLEQPPTPF